LRPSRAASSCQALGFTDLIDKTDRLSGDNADFAELHLRCDKEKYKCVPMSAVFTALLEKLTERFDDALDGEPLLGPCERCLRALPQRHAPAAAPGNCAAAGRHAHHATHAEAFRQVGMFLWGARIQRLKNLLMKKLEKIRAASSCFE